jgi:hypothetical protein
MQYKEKILITISGHDHTGLLRSYSNDGEEFMGINIIPAMTPYDGQNPSYSVLEVNEDTYQLSIDYYYIQLKDTYVYSGE